MLIVYLAILISVSYWVVKTLAPEMAKPPLPKTRIPVPSPIELSELDQAKQRIEKLETLLDEKNRNISLFQKEIKVFQMQICSFDKVKLLLEEEIQRLREQNRIFRSELGMPAVSASHVRVSDKINVTFG